MQIKRPIKTVYNNIVGCLAQNGQIAKVKKILDLALVAPSTDLSLTSFRALRLFTQRAGTIVEVKKLQQQANGYFVPFIVHSSRRKHLLSKEVKTTVTSSVKRISSERKISEYFQSILSTDNFEVYPRYKRSFDIIASRANIHFRW